MCSNRLFRRLGTAVRPLRRIFRIRSDPRRPSAARIVMCPRITITTRGCRKFSDKGQTSPTLSDDTRGWEKGSRDSRRFRSLNGMNPKLSTEVISTDSRTLTTTPSTLRTGEKFHGLRMGEKTRSIMVGMRSRVYNCGESTCTPQTDQTASGSMT